MPGQQQSLQRQRRLHPKDYEEHMTWRIRWFLIIAITIIYALALLSGLIGYWKTNDAHYLLFITPTALMPFVYYLVPMDKRRYELKLAKIHANKELYETQRRVQVLEAEQRKLQKPEPTK